MYVRSWNGITRYRLEPNPTGAFSGLRAQGSGLKHTAHKYPMATKAVVIGIVVVVLLGALSWISAMLGCPGGSLFAVQSCSGTFGFQAGGLVVQAILVIIFAYVILWIYHRV